MSRLNINIRHIAMSTILIRGVGVIQGVLLMRLVAPEHHGFFAAAAAAIVLLGHLSEQSATDPWIVAHPERGDKALSTLRSFAVVRALLLSTAIVLMAGPLSTLLGDSDQALAIQPILSLLTISLIVTALQNPTLRREEGRQNFKRVVGLEAGAQILGAAVGIGVALKTGNALALLATFLVPQIVVCLGSYLWFPRTVGWTFDKILFKEALAWGWPFWVVGLLSTITAQVDDLFVSKFASAETLGFYAKAFFWSTTSSIVIMQAFTRALFPRIASQLKQPDQIRQDVSMCRRSIVKFLFVIHGLLIIFAPQVSHLLGGPAWDGMVPFLRIFLVMALFRVLARLSGQVLGALGRSRRTLTPKLVEACLLVLLAYPAFQALGALGIAWLSLALYTLSWIWHDRLLKVELDRLGTTSP